MNIQKYQVTYTIKGVTHYGFEWVFAKNAEEARKKVVAFMKEDGIVCDPGSLRVTIDKRRPL
jgi:hypothetical protein